MSGSTAQPPREVDLLRRAVRSAAGVCSLPGDRPLCVVPPEEAGVLTDPLRLEVRFAPTVVSSLTGRSSGLVSWGSTAGSLTLGWDGRGRVCLELASGADTHVLSCEWPVEPARWVRADAVIADATATLFVDGEPVDQRPWPHGVPRAAGGGIVVGSRWDSARVEAVFDAEAAAGYVASALMVAGAAASRPTSLDSRRLPAADPVEWLESIAGADPHRPAYHFAPPAHWMNEPHAPIEVAGRHHLFFQANRRGPFWGGIEWGHAVSHDLVHWRHLPPALTPDPGSVARDGVWSGSSVVDDQGRHLLLVTAGDLRRTPDQAVALAAPTVDGRRWTIEPRRLIEMPEGVDGLDLLPGQFRDPFVWRTDAGWFMLVGAGVADVGGTALLYRSPDGEHWSLQGPLLTGDRAAHPETGEMWELPVLLPVRAADGREKHVLLVCPWWGDSAPHPVVDVVYWLGVWREATGTFTPDSAEPRRLDHGRHFTGPSGYVTSDGRTVLWSIAQDGRDAETRFVTGWAHNAGLPLELGLTADDELAIWPVATLSELRDEAVEVGEPPFEVDDAGRQLEIELVAEPGAGDVVVGLHVDAELAHAELTVTAGQLRLHRPGAAAYDGWWPQTRDTAPLRPAARHTVRMFVDGSMLEVYVDGRVSMTSRVYPPEAARGLTIGARDGARIERVRAWRLRGAGAGVSDVPVRAAR